MTTTSSERRGIPHAVVMMLLIIIAAVGLTWVVPSGRFQRDKAGAPGVLRAVSGLDHARGPAPGGGQHNPGVIAQFSMREELLELLQVRGRGILGAHVPRGDRIVQVPLPFGMQSPAPN